MICDFLHFSPQRYIIYDADIYCIPSRNGKLRCICETSKNLHVRLKVHKRDIRFGNLNNALLQHISSSDHNF